MNCVCLGEIANCLHRRSDGNGSIATIQPAYSTIPTNALELEISSQFWLSNNTTGFHNDDTMLYSTALGGFFIANHEADCNNLVLQATTMKSGNILVAVLKEGYWQIILRLVTSAHRVFCLSVENGQYLRSGGRIPAKFAKNTALVVCIKPKEDFSLDIDVKLFGANYGHIHWDTASLTVSEALTKVDEFVKTDSNDFHCCPECLVISPNGHGHLSPCAPLFTVSTLKDNCYARRMHRLFDLRFESPNYDIKVLRSHQFIDVVDQMVLNNETLEGIFTFKKVLSGKRVISFDTISAKRFAILFAFCRNNAWRLRLCLMFTTQNGVLGFKATKTMYADANGFEVPPAWKASTALLFGIQHGGNNDIDISVRVHTQSMYECQLSYDWARDEMNLSDELKPSKAIKRPFHSNMIRPTQRPIASLIHQRYVEGSEHETQNTHNDMQQSNDLGAASIEVAAVTADDNPIENDVIASTSQASGIDAAFNDHQYWNQVPQTVDDYEVSV